MLWCIIIAEYFYEFHMLSLHLILSNGFSGILCVKYPTVGKLENSQQPMDSPQVLGGGGGGGGGGGC